jgi:hypothetical protein
MVVVFSNIYEPGGKLGFVDGREPGCGTRFVIASGVILFAIIMPLSYNSPAVFVAGVI